MAMIERPQTFNDTLEFLDEEATAADSEAEVEGGTGTGWVRTGDGARGCARPRRARARRAQLVSAPSEAEPTCCAYLPSTPRRVRSAAAARRRPRAAAISSSLSSTLSSRFGDVEDDGVAVADGRDRAAARRLGRDVAGHEAVRGAGEAAVGEQRDGVAEALAHERGGDAEHLAHAGPAGGPLVADHDDVVRLDRALP